MKRLVLIVSGIIICLQVFAQSQTDSLPPYKKYPTLPAFEILMLDSTTTFNTYDIPKGKPTILMYFSPECDHCEKMTEELLKNMDDLKPVQIYMITPMSLSLLRTFYLRTGVNRYKNITVGQDHKFFFTDFFLAKYVPYLAIYDKNKKLVATYDGEAKLKDIKEALGK